MELFGLRSCEMKSEREGPGVQEQDGGIVTSPVVKKRRCKLVDKQDVITAVSNS